MQITTEIVEAHDMLKAKRKLNTILRSKAVKGTHVSVGDIVKVFIKTNTDKRGHWTQPMPVLKFDPSSKTFTIARKRGRFMDAAIEDVRHAIGDDTILAFKVQNSIDTCNDSIELALSELEQSNPKSSTTDADFEGVSEPCTTTQHIINPVEDGEPSTQTASIDTSQIEHIPNTHSSDFTMNLRNTPRVNYSATIALQPGQELISTEQHYLQLYLDRFGHKEFLISHAQGLPTYTTENAYATEEAAFLNKRKKVSIQDVPMSANVIRSHVLYKIKERDCKSMHYKARMTPHGHEEMEKDNLKTDCAICALSVIRVLLSIVAIFRFSLVKVDLKSAFLQSGSTDRDVYVCSPRECSKRRFYSLLGVLAYGLVNANAKWQRHSDNTFTNLGLKAVVYIPQLFFLSSKGELDLTFLKAVDDILIGWKQSIVNSFLNRLSKVQTLGTITKLPGRMNFFGQTIEYDDDGVVRISGDDKINALKPYLLNRLRRKQIDNRLNAVELSAFRSLNGSLGFIGMTVSNFASYACSALRQSPGEYYVRNLVKQNTMLKSVQRIGFTSNFCRPETKGSYAISIKIFADAGHPGVYGQLGFIGGILIGPLSHGSTIHILNWSSHLSKRPAKSSGTAETFASSEAIEEGKILTKCGQRLLGISVDLTVVVDSRELFLSLSTSRRLEDKSIEGDIQLMRYNFETYRLNKLIWIPGKVNIADPLTKRDSSLSEILQLMLFEERIPIDLTSMDIRKINILIG